MNEVEQRFVQVCASNGSLLVTEAVDILRPICEQCETEVPENSKLKEFITTINNHLNQYDHDIAFIKYPLNKKEFIVFRTLHSKEMRSVSFLTEQDRSYFRRLLTAVATAENYGIPEMLAINLTTQVQDKQLPKNRAEQLLQNWKSIGYFLESDGTLFLGPRMIVEFESFLLDGFPDALKQCPLCKKLVLWDPPCKSCETKFHSECIRKYLIKSSNCPSCHELWSTPFN